MPTGYARLSIIIHARPSVCKAVLLDLGHVVYDESKEDLISEHGSLATMVFDYIGSDER